MHTDVAVIGCLIENHIATSGSGAIVLYLQSSRSFDAFMLSFVCSIRHTVCRNNKADRGGCISAISTQESTQFFLKVFDSTIENNTAVFGGSSNCCWN